MPVKSLSSYGWFWSQHGLEIRYRFGPILKRLIHSKLSYFSHFNSHNLKTLFPNLFLTSESSYYNSFMLCNIMLCQPEKVSKQYGCAKVGLKSLIMFDIDNISLNIVRYLLKLSDILSNILEYQPIMLNIAIFCLILSVIFKSYQL